MKRFRYHVLSRLLLLSVLLVLFFYLLANTRLFMVTLVVGGLAVSMIFGLFRYVERTNRELSRLFQSIRSDDFTQSFSFQGLGPSFAELNRSFNQVLKQFLKLRSEKEEHFRYLRTVVQHVGVGLICFKANGDVELINNTAKQLLGLNRLKNIQALASVSQPLVEALFVLKSGENTSLKLETEQGILFLSIHATQFKLHGELYSLVSIQNIRGEIEREQLTKELEIAWGIQKSMLPGDDPQYDGYDIAGSCIPAREVGGDYYDYIHLADGRLVMVVADVSGKGISASFYMTLVKGFITPLLMENPSPKRVLCQLNDLLYGTLKRKSFVTMFLAVLDGPKNEILCARAGHTPAVHYTWTDKKCIKVQPEGIALGILPGGKFNAGVAESRLTLAPGDWFILYTDGFVEAKNGELEEFGEERFLDLIGHGIESRAVEMISSISLGVDGFVSPAQTRGKQETAQHDDMTIVAMRRTKTSAPNQAGVSGTVVG